MLWHESSMNPGGGVGAVASQRQGRRLRRSSQPRPMLFSLAYRTVQRGEETTICLVDPA